jgi:hypothetical protein
MRSEFIDAINPIEIRTATNSPLDWPKIFCATMKAIATFSLFFCAQCPLKDGNNIMASSVEFRVPLIIWFCDRQEKTKRYIH